MDIEKEAKIQSSPRSKARRENLAVSKAIKITAKKAFEAERMMVKKDAPAKLIAEVAEKKTGENRAGVLAKVIIG